MSIECSKRRKHRAATVVQLSALRKSSGLVEDPRWNRLGWLSLHTLPDWCALDAPTRQTRICIAGAIILSPGIRRCLKGDTLVQLRDLIGAEPLQWIQRRPYRAATGVSNIKLAEDGHGLRRQLLAQGIHALIGGVDEPAIRALLLDAMSKALLGSDTSADGEQNLVNDDAESVPEIDPQTASIAAELQVVVDDAGAATAQPPIDRSRANSQRAKPRSRAASRNSAVHVTSTRLN